MSREVWFLGPTELQAQSDTASIPSAYSETEEPALGVYTTEFQFHEHVQENLDDYNLMDKVTTRLQGDPERYKLTRPTASLIRSNCVYPGVYRCGHNVANIEELAQILRAPDDWMARLNPLLTNATVLQYFQKFSELPFGTSEARIESKLNGLVSLVASNLNVYADSDDKISFGVGGILPVENHAVVGESDTVYRDSQSRMKFVTEMKTREAYRANETWYWRSRACQATAALYYSRAPVLLCSPECFKVLVLTENMDNINYFPGGAHSGLTSSDTFRLAIGLLILSQRVFSTEATIKVPTTPPTLHLRPKEDTLQTRKRRRTSKRSTGTSSKYKIPSSSEFDEPVEDDGIREIFFLTKEEIDSVLKAPEEPQEVFESIVAQTEFSAEEWSGFESEKTEE
ncbi:hypothetical protein MP638_005939 [Amoeboaphelidium occidentale]|nr:hypothetical protein MP638_005939 [Amoeboaphelidium occidentale]